MKLDWLLSNLKEDQIAKATFADDEWFVIKSHGAIRYLYNGAVLDLVPLTYSNINATYEITGQRG